jgi:hypothetical protein
MIFKIFTSYDEKAQAYHVPFFLPKTAQAIRHFADSINKPDTPLNLHPADYSLHCLGTFDDETGELKYETKSLGNGVDFIQPLTPDQLGADFGLVENQLKALKS